MNPPEQEWARFGSYLVFLKLEQDVELFHKVMGEQAQKLKDQGIDFMTRALLRAKAVGRWPSGAPVKPGARKDPFENRKPTEEELRIRKADFKDDPKGDGCPLFAHIRKANPRGSLESHGVDEVRQHRIIRRGIPYGPRYVEGAGDAKDDRGLLFLAYQADISRQFEFLLRRWMDNPSFPKQEAPSGWEPLMGTDAAHHESPDAAFVAYYHREGRKEVVPTDFATASFRRFIRSKGGGYFFAPSIPALAALATDQIPRRHF